MAGIARECLAGFELEWLVGFDRNTHNSVISASAGLVGVLLGGLLTSLREAGKESDRIQREANYLAAQTVSHLERLANGCLRVAKDDGTTEGRPAGGTGDYHQTTISPPQFDPLELKVDWKVLPPLLMTEILRLPYRMEQLEFKLDEVWRLDEPPDHPDFFWARQELYAELGLEVSALSLRLRAFAGLPEMSRHPDEKDRDRLLEKQRDRVHDERKSYEARLASNPHFISHSPPVQ